MLPLKPTHPVIKNYYREIARLAATGHVHEGAVAPLFAHLLRHCTGHYPHLDFIEQYPLKRDGRSPLFPDGAVVDQQTKVLVYGLWEAKDLSDDLDREVAKKFKAGYPKENILFQTPHRLVIYRHGVVIFDSPIDQSADNLIRDLDTFFSYQPPAYEQWQQAIAAFKDKVGESGLALVQMIHKALTDNPPFQAAFHQFRTLCRSAINPNLADAAVIEMLVQHLLTERLFRTVFNTPEFIAKNAIAVEIEKVITALTLKSFSRAEFLKSLDHFYQAIESAAATIHDYSRKQAFLNVVYEQFFQGFAVKVADTHGIVYTPQPIVDFMVHSVEALLQREFHRSLAQPAVQVLDPFVGTGNFMVRILREIAATAQLSTAKVSPLTQKYREELWCNEVLLLPYYIASMNIEHAYYELMKEYEPFPGICLVDTFELAEERQHELFVPENTQRVAQQKQASLFVIIGNPPYNAGQVNENDNNRNRKYPTLDKRVAETYAKASKATNLNALSDPYVKAFRYASDRILQSGEGIVAFVTNNGFLDGIAFDGFRKTLFEEFSRIYIVDLKGNVRKDSMRDGIPIGEQHTVFGLSAMVGVSILFLIRANHHTEHKIFYYGVHFRSKRTEKFELLDRAKTYQGIEWQELTPDKNHTWLTEGLRPEFETFLPMGTKEAKAGRAEAIFSMFSNGVKTNRDTWAYNFNAHKLAANIQRMMTAYNDHVARYRHLATKPDIDEFVNNDGEIISWSESLKNYLRRGLIAEYKNQIRDSLYRPFCRQFLYFDPIFNERRYQMPVIFPTPQTEQENRVICVKSIGMDKPFHAIMVNQIPDVQFTPNGQCFPYYTYDETGHHRKDNLSDWALTQFQTHYRDETITKWDIFHYLYGLLHHPDYRTQYAANLRRELPRIPFAPDFWAFSKVGQQLADLHVNYEQQPEYPLQLVATAQPIEWRVTKMRLAKDKTQLIYNDTLTIRDIPAIAFEYRLGHRSALEWLIDQYQIKTDKRSGITNDPNRADDEKYIVRLIKQVVYISVRTVELIQQLPPGIPPRFAHPPFAKGG